MILRQQPRFPGSTLDERLALYGEVLAFRQHAVTIGKFELGDVFGTAAQDLDALEPYLVLTTPLPEGTLDILIQRPDERGPSSILVEPFAFGELTPRGVRIPLPLAPDFDRHLPTGTAAILAVDTPGPITRDAVWPLLVLPLVPTA